MTVSEHNEGIFEKFGTMHYKYKYRTDDGEEFIISSFIEDVPEALRGRLFWVPTRLSIRLHDVLIDIVRELEK